jgi:TRAP-type uncharacterized transport system substrate-binding protein
MLPEKIKRLIEQLVDASYDSGYYSGQKKDGTNLHMAAIQQREHVRKKLSEEIVFQIAVRDMSK